MNTQLTSNGAHSPFFNVVVAQDFGFLVSPKAPTVGGLWPIGLLLFTVLTEIVRDLPGGLLPPSDVSLKNGEHASPQSTQNNSSEESGEVFESDDVRSFDAWRSRPLSDIAGEPCCVTFCRCRIR